MNKQSEEWISGAVQRARAIDDALEEVCSAVRKLRTQSVQFDRKPVAPRTRGLLFDYLENSASFLEIFSGESANRIKNYGTDSADPVIRDFVLKFSSEVNSIELFLRSFDCEHAKLIMERSSLTISAPDTSVKKVNISQRQSKNFARLANVFQAKDSFDQRIEHVNFAISRLSALQAQSTLSIMGVINAQTSNISEMSIDSCREYMQSIEEIREFVETNMPSDQPQADEDHVAAKKFAASCTEPLQRLLSATEAFTLEISSDEPDSEFEDAVDKENFKSLIVAWYDLVAAKLSPTLNLKDAKQPVSHDLQEILASLNSLQASVQKLCLASKQTLEFNHACERGEQLFLAPDAEELLSSLEHSYTMDVEREVHAAAVLRMRKQ